MAKSPKTKVPNPPKVEAPPGKTPLVFYHSAAGREPVREWLVDMGPPGRNQVGLDLMRAQFRWPIGMPLVRPLGKGLHEVRTSLADGTEARVFLCFWGGALYALHGIVKKTQKSPQGDLDIARERQKEVENGKQ